MRLFAFLAILAVSTSLLVMGAPAPVPDDTDTDATDTNGHDTNGDDNGDDNGDANGDDNGDANGDDNGDANGDKDGTDTDDDDTNGFDTGANKIIVSNLVKVAQNAVKLGYTNMERANQHMISVSKELKVERARRIAAEKRLREIQSDLAEMKSQISMLEETSVKYLKEDDDGDNVDEKGRIDQKMLPGSYSTTELEDLQWQSLHMAAAAACQGSTKKGGHGDFANAVLASTTGKSCKSTCENTRYQNCDASVSLFGKPYRATSNTQVLGKYYNYGCERKSRMSQDEAAQADDKRLAADLGSTLDDYEMFSYCCCRA